jgi:tellurite resistance protein
MQARNLLSSAVEMAIADGRIDENERKLLFSLGKHLGLKDETIKNSIQITLKQKSH